MSALWRVIRLLWRAAPRAFAGALMLSFFVMAMGAALLGLSGWFITATGLAGMAGIGVAFDVFRPSAAVRFLALGRTAARYGERIVAHEATLRALAALRVALLRRHAHMPGPELARLRRETVLTRIVSDVDALDGVMLRLVLPVLAGIAVHLSVFIALWALVGLPVAIAVLGGALLAGLVLWRLSRRAEHLSDDLELGEQSLRRGVIDIIRDREALILAGRLSEAEEQLVRMDETLRQTSDALDHSERNAGAALSLIVALAAGLGLLAGGWLLARGQIGVAPAVIGFFVALALAETILPLRRGFAEMGRMRGAAERVFEGAENVANTNGTTSADEGSVVHWPERGIQIGPGEAVALTGPSGAGKTTLLLQIAGLQAADGLLLGGYAPTRWDERALRGYLTMLPQRSALMAGTIREALAMGAPIDDPEMWDALRAVDLDEVIAARGGLEATLGEGGSGLSGGQARRLALARCVLRRPQVLLLDEPSEGLDPLTAERVLHGVRVFLPNSTIIAALHRNVEHQIFTREIAITGR